MAETFTPDSLDLAEPITRVLRVMDEPHKFVAEQQTLMAEAAKLERDRALAPWRVALAGMTAGAAFFGAGFAYVKLLGP
ncbi:hypothetical protein MKK75_05490 [Methylobacterium sp. J-030]|uniref:hypothetical protein n=1 Tax=Methylobacterium sp. J-030 TaxID=2836627 RepID=UPI001FBA5720|nr:hypothetical protein [Methylobacterium sp. J-030]MCJ2068265.1 hypothetical protein [Methylobacterium sp. J-030]